MKFWFYSRYVLNFFLERRAGMVKVSVYSQGKALGTEDLRYSSPGMDALSGIHQIYIRQIDEICSLLSNDQLLELDNCLSLILHDESKGLIPAVAFEYFHKVFRLQSSGKFLNLCALAEFLTNYNVCPFIVTVSFAYSCPLALQSFFVCNISNISD